MSKTSTVQGQRLTAQGIVKRIFQIREIVILLLVLLLCGNGMWGGFGGMGGWHGEFLKNSDVVNLMGIYDIKPERNELAA